MGYIGDKRNQQQIDDDYRLLAVLPNGAVWNNGAGGYVLKGKVVSTTPQFVPKDDPNSLYNVDPAAVQQAQSRGKTDKAAVKAGTVDNSGKNNSNNLSSSGGSGTTSGTVTTSGTSLGGSGFSMEDLIRMLNPDYNPLTDEQILAQAGSEVDASLATQLADIANEEGTVNARYKPLLAALDQTFDKAGGEALKSGNARGLGDSGIVDYERNKLETNIAGQITGLQGQQQAELSGLSNKRTALSGSRSNLITTAAGRIRDNQNSNRNTLITAASPLISKYMDKTLVDADTKFNGGITTAEDVGYVPGADNSNEMLGLRATGGNKVGWNGTNATVNGVAYTNDVLTGMGGELRNNSWYLPRKALAALGLI